MRFCLLAVLLGGCAFESGERLESGACPPGETCHSGVPGLTFTGTPPAGYVGDLLPTAVGGTQTIFVSGFEGFEVQLTPGALSVEEALDDEVVLRGVEAGSALLRVVHPVDHTLLDRITLTAETIERVGLALWLSALPNPAVDQEVALFPGAEGYVSARLYGADGGLVIDEGMSLTIDGAPGAALGWDTVAIAAPPSGSVRLEVAAAGIATSFDIPVVDRVDRITIDDGRLTLWGGTESREVEVGASGLFCFIGLAAGRRILGTPITVEAVGPVTVTEGSATGCALITGLREGSAEVTARFDGAPPFAITVPVVAATGARRSALTTPRPFIASEQGERGR